MERLALVVPHAGTWIEIAQNETQAPEEKVVPHAGTWIEIEKAGTGSAATVVVPHAGTWIEMMQRFIKI